MTYFREKEHTDFNIYLGAAVFTRKLVASIGQRIMLEKALGKIEIDSDWNAC
ncbi:MAG: hypothetical protein QXF52_02645 [Thermoproteota archaeon]